MTRPPLSGLKVLELGELIAGPFVGTLLGEFGAEVIKIERPGRGDVLRQFGPMVKGESLYWAVNGRNKKSVVLDLKKAAGRTVLGELIARCERARQQPPTRYRGILGIHRGGPEDVLSDAGARPCQRVRPYRPKGLARRL